MKTAEPALVALLESGEPFVMWEVYTITLLDGSVIEWATTELPAVGLPAGDAGAPAALTG